MKKRKFSPAQLAAQKRFAALAKAGKLRRKNGKKKNTTIIKAKKISHLDVSKVHNGKKRTVSARRNAEHRDAAHPIHVRDYWQGAKAINRSGSAPMRPASVSYSALRILR